MSPIRVQTASEGWLDVDLSQYAIKPTADIYAGYLQTSPDNHPWLGIDQTTWTDRSYSLPDWTALLPHGAAAMIRVVLGTPRQRRRASRLSEVFSLCAGESG